MVEAMDDEEEFREWLSENCYTAFLSNLPDRFLVLLIRNDCCLLTLLLTLPSTVPSGDFFRSCARYRRVRRWLVSERLRRMGKLKSVKDVLVSQLAVEECEVDPPSSCIVEVTPGVVSIVGEEIHLCGE
jgi:hypothetical protein